MTKKIFAMFLAVLMVVSMLPTSVFAAGTCPYKGTGLHTAENCDNTVIGEPVAATCNAAGFTAYKCNACGDEFHDNVTPATGAHTWENVGDIEPTCEKEGWKDAKECSVCHKVEGKTRIAPLGEKNGVQVYNCQWEITNPQIDCLTGGEQIWKCVNCGDEKTVKIDKKAAHAWGDFQLITAATATTNGKAERVCKDCGAKDEVVVFAAHNCKYHLIEVDGFAKTCTTAGQHDYQECRVCGTKYGYVLNGHLVNANEGGSLTRLTGNNAYLQGEIVIPASHTFMKDGKPYSPTCADTLLQCQAAGCGQWVNPGVEHDIDWVVTEDEKKNDGAEYVPSTCLKPGYIYDVCANCDVRHLKTLTALGHHDVEVKVPATCATNAYSFTYCTRPGCDQPAVNTDNADYAIATGDNRYDLKVHQFLFNENAPVVGTGYYMALNHMDPTVNTVLYFNGTGTGEYLNTTNDVAEAVKVYVEKVHLLDTKGEFYLYFENAEGVKTYIEMYKNSYGSVKVRLTTEKPATVFTWNSANKVLSSKVSGTEYFLNCYTDSRTGKTFETISASKIDYALNATTYRASLVDTTKEAVPYIIAFTMNKDAGFNSSNHGGTWNSEIVTAATCTVDGKKIVTCSFCGDFHEETIPAGHTWRNATNDEVPGKTENAFQEAGCVDGWQWKICSVSGCGATKKDTVTGSGHVYGNVVEFVPSHTATTGFDTKTCKYCTDGTEGHSVNLTYRVWEYIGVQFESLTAAEKAHGGASNLSLSKVLSTGDCDTFGLSRYYCSSCQKDVLVKTEGKHVAPAEINGIPVHQDPTCLDKGWDLTYQCTVAGCGAVVGAAALGQKNDIPALGHDYEMEDDHECADHDYPNYTHDHKECTRCSDETEGHFVKCYVKNEEITVWANNGADLCEKTVIEYYWCEQCQDEHIRGFVEAMGHEWKDFLNNKGEYDYTLEGTKAPTCTESGVYKQYCDVCDAVRTQTVAPIAHVNKANEKFFENCQDKVTDRHCVVCCVCTNEGASHDCTADQDKAKPGVQPCDCVISTDCQWNKVLMPSNCSMAPYWTKSCPDCGARENEVVTEYVFDETVGAEEIVHMGHKPAEIDYVQATKDGKLVFDKDGKPVMEAKKYPGFTYEEYTYVWYTVVEGKLVKHTETYTAKFIERKAASYIEEGYDLFVCQICNSEEKNVKAKLSGLGFEFSVENALGGNEFTYGSLVEVIVSVNGNNAAVHGFNFNVSVANAVAGAKFVGYEKLNEDFNLVVLKPENTGSKATISGFAANDASGKQQNITINGKTELVKLYFRLADKAFVDASSLTAKFEPVPNQPAVTVLKDGNSVDVSANTNILNKDFATRGFLNFNNDTAANTKDLQMAMSMITLEHVDGKTYDVTVDVNKDGVVDLQDLSIAYNYVVGNYDLVDLLVMGISAEEILLLDLNEKTFCNSSACGKEIDADAVYCPFCGNHQ